MAVDLTTEMEVLNQRREKRSNRKDDDEKPFKRDGEKPAGGPIRLTNSSLEDDELLPTEPDLLSELNEGKIGDKAGEDWGDDNENLAKSGGTTIADSPAGAALEKLKALLESQPQEEPTQKVPEEPDAPVALEGPKSKDVQKEPPVVEEPTVQESKEEPSNVIQISLNQDKLIKFASKMDKENIEKFLAIFPNAVSISVNVGTDMGVPVIRTIGVRGADGQEVFVPAHLWRTCVENCVQYTVHGKDAGLGFKHPDRTLEPLVPGSDPKEARDMFSRMEFNGMKLPPHFTLAGELLKNVVPPAAKS